MTNKQLQTVEFYKGYYNKEAKENNHGKVWVNNRVNKIIEKMDLISQSENKVKEIVVFISFNKKYKATTTTKVFKENSFEEYHTAAGGYGYDKASHSLGEALNKDIDCLAMIYNQYKNDKENKPYGIDNYDSGLGFGQGVGMSCYRNITKWLGGKWYEQYDDQTGNYFYRMTF